MSSKKAARIRKFLLLIGIIFFIILALLVVRKKKQKLAKIPPPKRAPLPVEVVKVRKGTLEITEHYLGKIRPLKETALSSRFTTYVLEIRKFEGDPVKKGEVLVLLDDRTLKARLKALKARLQAARITFLTRQNIFERDRILYENKALSKEAFELSKARLAEAEAQVTSLKQEIEALKVDLSYTRLRAPFDGVVRRRYLNPGDLALPGKPILELEDPEAGYRVFVSLAQEKIRKIHPGAKAYLVENKKRLPARVFSVHPATEAGGLGTVEIRVSKRPFALPSYGDVGVDLALEEVKGFLVPLKAVLENVKKDFLFCAQPTEKDMARLRVIPVHFLGRAQEKAALSGKIPTDCLAVVAEEATLLSLHEGQIVRLSGEWH